MLQSLPNPVKKSQKSKSPQKAQSLFKASVQDQTKTLTEKYRDSYPDTAPVTFNGDSASQENVELLIRTAYKQVFGNAHLMESERSREIESQFRNGQITVSDFIRKLGKSERYKALFWEKCPNVTTIELNFKHLLGRAPESQDEIAQHIKILTEDGFEAEIDSYIDSEEYIQNFGDDQVPYFRGYSSQTGRNVVGFTHSFPLLGVACSSDKSTLEHTSPKLQTNLIQNNPSSIPPLRPIPDSYPESFVLPPETNIPPEFRMMAKELLSKFTFTNLAVLPSLQDSGTTPKIDALQKLSVVELKSKDESLDAETSTEKTDISDNSPEATIKLLNLNFERGLLAKDYSISKTSSYPPLPNRRPGANLNKFIDLVRNIPARLREK
ncbi:MAG: hypothetical protein F6K40_37615 [Okeania sp. SIO3I5]|uniref:phycobilisome rod-core linker polypeptide n=1 Tax=Okeania sp. SIO3I5 TaxID=2607805 RepID=UPI0013BAA544|nr:phycobilisome rod-core linker polypeptide [Okeania sp. SIO3I5]NEQ41608.1 hypothetical protein [Okeania sp. SIO3I5]